MHSREEENYDTILYDGPLQKQANRFLVAVKKISIPFKNECTYLILIIR